MMLIENLFLSVGAMKAGTTWLYAQLGDHPDVFFSNEKEVHYFAHVHLPDRPLTAEGRLNRYASFAKHINPRTNDIQRSRKHLLWYANYLAEPVNDLWYANLFAFKGQQKYCADFSNLYALLEAPGWEHVRRVARNIRVIYTLRDPAKRLWSHTKFHMQFIGKTEEMRTWSRANYAEFISKRFIDVHTHYAEVVRRLRSNLSEQEVRFYFFEDFRRDAVGSLRDLESFLEVRPKAYNTGRIDEKVNASVDVKMPDFFPELCRPMVDREVEALSRLGLAIPESWGRVAQPQSA